MHQRVLVSLVLFAVWGGAGSLTAQSAVVHEARTVSPYVPLDHWAMPVVEHLIRRGVIDDPAPLTRPFRRNELYAVLNAADTTRLDRTTVESIRRLLEEMESPFEGSWARFEAFGGVRAGTYQRRDALREEGTEAVSPRLGGAVEGTAGAVVVGLRGEANRRLALDPDYTGVKDFDVFGRLADAYGSLQGRYGELFFGATARNWGPPGLHGLLISDAPYSYDHLFARVGSSTVSIQWLLTELDAIWNSTGERVRRFVSASRIVIEPWSWCVASFGQGALWSGVGRGIDFWWANPFKAASLTRQDENLPDSDSVNAFYTAALRVKVPGRVTVHVAGLLDDLASFFGGSRAPDRVGFTAVVDVPLETAVFRSYYTVVSSLAYRSPAGSDQTPMRRGIGLGRNYSDYRELGVQVSWVPLPLVVFRPEAVLLDQGEGDFRDPFPPLPLTDHPFLFEGTVERTLRIGLNASAAVGRHLTLEGDVGIHHVANADHQVGVTRNRFVASVQATYRLGWSWPLR